MLKYTGVLNGEAVEGQVVSAKEIAEQFGIELPTKLVIRRIAKGRDRFGQLKGGDSLSVPTVFYGNMEGEGSFELRYYSREINQRDGIRFLPHKLKVANTKTFNMRSELEIAVFLLLHPWNSHSPFASKRTHFEVYDRDEENKARIAKETQIANLRKEIMEADGEAIMRVCRGIDIRNVQVPIQPDEASARLTLLDLTAKYPGQVGAAMKDNRVAIRGLAGLAIDRGLVNQKQNRWAYKDGTTAAEIGAGEEPFSALVAWLYNADNIASFTKRIHADGVKNAVVETKFIPTAAVEAEVIDPKELVKRALEAGVLYIDTVVSKVFLVRDGVTQKIPIASGVNNEQELIDRADSFGKPVIGRIKNSF